MNAVAALNAILGRWGTKPPTTWNITGDPCSGIAIDETIDIDNSETINPGIKCDCSYNDSTVCHITKLYVTLNRLLPPAAPQVFDGMRKGEGAMNFSKIWLYFQAWSGLI